MTLGLELSAATRDGLLSCAAIDSANEDTDMSSVMSLPPGAYTEQASFEHEQRAIFRHGWVPVGRSDRWLDVGSYSAMDLGGVPMIVVRDKQRDLRAYANTCRHRGSQILTGSGTCSTMKCPFHAWTYALDGGLLGAPSMHRTVDFAKADHGLHSFATAEHNGFAFVSLDPSPPSIDAWLGDFDAQHAPWPLSDLVMTRRREFVVDCNWKLFAEVFNEYYHLPYVHPGSIDSTYQAPDDPDLIAGAFATHFGLTNGTGGLLESAAGDILPTMPGLGGRDADGVRYTWLFPTLVIATGAEAMWAYEVYPLSATQTQCAQFVCFPPDTVERSDFEAKASSYYKRFDVAIAEDIPVLEQQQRGLTSPFATQGPFSYLEPSVARFAGWYAKRMVAAD